MKKLLLLLTITLLSFTSNAQVEFNTNRTTHPTLGDAKMKISFNLSEDKVEYTFLDKGIVKRQQKMGISSTQVIDIPQVNKEVQGIITTYTYQNATKKIVVVVFDGDPKKNSVKMLDKDDFTNEVKEQLYYSI